MVAALRGEKKKMGRKSIKKKRKNVVRSTLCAKDASEKLQTVNLKYDPN